MIGWYRVVISKSPTLCRHMKIFKSSFLFAFESKSFGEPITGFLSKKKSFVGLHSAGTGRWLGQALQFIAKDAEASLGIFRCLETQYPRLFCFKSEWNCICIILDGCVKSTMRIVASSLRQLIIVCGVAKYINCWLAIEFFGEHLL